MSTRFSGFLKIKSVENILGFLLSRGCKFKTDKILRQSKFEFKPGVIMLLCNRINDQKTKPLVYQVTNLKYSKKAPVMPELGGPLAPPIFGRSVNPIPTGGGQIMPTSTTGPPKVFHLSASLT